VRIINETRLIPLGARRGQIMTGRVQVRGVDLLSGAQGMVWERHTPDALLVRDAAGEREFAIADNRGRGLLPFLVAPAAALIIGRMMRRGRRRKGHR
jgi:hypothetical protein